MRPRAVASAAAPTRRLGLRGPALTWLVAALACGTSEEKSQKAEANPNMPDRVHAPAPEPRRPSVTTCPEALNEPEQLDRVIGSACKTVTVYPGYRIENGTLTIEAGVTLQFMPGAELAVGFERAAQLLVRGTPEAPVRFTAAGEQAKPGAWKGVALYDHADGSEIHGLVLEFAGTDLRGAIYVQAEDVKIDNSTVRDSQNVAVHVTSKGHLSSFKANRLERVSSPALLLPARSAGSVTADNTFPPDSVIHVLGGMIRERARWDVPKVPFVIGGVIEIEGVDEKHEALLELAPGTVLKFDDDAYFTVGYDYPAALIAEAAGKEPIVLTSATRQTSHAWRGVNLYRSATASFSNVVFEYGGQRSDRGVLYANNEARLTVKGCTFRDNGGGVTLQGANVRLGELRGNTFERSHPAFDVSPQLYGMIAADNKLDAGTTVQVEGGEIGKDAVWHDFGVPIELKRPIAVDGEATLTIRPGAKIRVHDGFALGVGEFGGGTLRIEGTAEQPVEIFGLTDRRGTWDAIRLYEKARGNLIEHATLRNAGGEGAINVAMGVDAIVRDVSCVRCFSPTLTWACGARVTAERVKAGAETPAATLPPFGCDPAG
ncbi:right-handed parallel beta-helix repeat-containing protein [Nannocystis radixulma]|uniref:Right-handed parallel beta-helix repeat-containing protein n=1 Tax=Nannocystis radixulma TaxID=2995305 RepID=A0ABT5BLU4_9BACT|nr:right-handed parallel beta-helix repeat-containing protein [Nannocystis radixulma]MDC0675137.1 right-handed parallel beta-helix repeat-containing protein [Nannocystis radixulma]